MPSVPFLGFILHIVAGHFVYLIAVSGNTSIRNTSYRCVKRTSPRESDRLQVGQAISWSLLCLKLYRDDDLAAHLCALRTWSGADVQSRLYTGILDTFNGLRSKIRPKIPNVPCATSRKSDGRYVSLGRMLSQNGTFVQL